MHRKIAGVTLAAGESNRMGFPKALCRFKGKRFLEHIVRTHQVHGIHSFVVLGSDAHTILKAIPLQGAEIAINRQPEKGPLSSIRTALPLIVGFEALLIHPIDHPCVKASTIGSLLRAFYRLPASILIPESAGRKGHPVLFPARFFSDLRQAPLEIGARWVTRNNRANIHYVPVNDAGITRNIDTPDDLENLTDNRPGIWLASADGKPRRISNGGERDQFPWTTREFPP